MTTDDLLQTANAALDLAADLLRQRTVGNVQAKSDRDLVSDLDVTIEREVKAILATRTPQIGFLGEEEGWTAGSHDRYWVLDPIDGTTNLIQGLPLCAISLALIDNDHTIVAGIDTPFLGARYTATADGGAHLNNERIQVSSTSRAADAVVALGDYAVGENAATKNELRLAVTTQLASQVQRIRMLGSAALDLAWVATGQLDAAICLSNKPWDTAAGVLIAREAGAQVVDTTGTDHTLHSPNTIAAPPDLIDRILTLINQAEAT